MERQSLVRSAGPLLSRGRGAEASLLTDKLPRIGPAALPVIDHVAARAQAALDPSGNAITTGRAAAGTPRSGWT